MDRANDSDWMIPRTEAIPRLMELHGGRLYALGSRICGDPEEANDLVQEIFMQAWRHWDQFAGRSNPITWLYSIARHACQRMHRKRAGEPTHQESLDDPLPFDSPRIAVLSEDEGGADAAIRSEQRDIIGTAIAALPIAFRMPLVLKDIVGFSVPDVAQILGVKEGTVKTRVHRARIRLRNALAEGLPQVTLPPPAYDEQLCLDLLLAKQESLDRGVEMPNADAIICDRCHAVFATLDLTKRICDALGAAALPENLRARLLDRMRAGED